MWWKCDESIYVLIFWLTSFEISRLGEKLISIHNNDQWSLNTDPSILSLYAVPVRVVCVLYASHLPRAITSWVKMLAVIVTAFYVIVATGIFNVDYPRENPEDQDRPNAQVSTNFPTNVCVELC